MFHYYTENLFNQDLGNWTIDSGIVMTDMFTGSAMGNTYNINTSRTLHSYPMATIWPNKQRPWVLILHQYLLKYIYLPS